MKDKIIKTAKHFNLSFTSRFVFPPNRMNVHSLWHEYIDYCEDTVFVQIRGNIININNVPSKVRSFINSTLEDFLPIEEK